MPTVMPADPARALPAEFLHCRLIGHSWQVTDGPRPHSYGIEIVLTCSVCTMGRHDVFTSTERLNLRTYQPPAGYRVDVDDGVARPTREHYRAEWYRRAQAAGKSARLDRPHQRRGSR